MIPGDNLTVTESNDWTQNGGRTSVIDNAVKYTPPENLTGTDAFWYVMTDSEGRTNSAKVSIEVTETITSAWPVGVNETIKITNDVKTIKISVLANDIGNGLTITETNDWTKQGGRTKIRGTKIKYWPPTDFVGLDTFWYVLTDSQGRTNSAKVRVRISEAAEVKKNESYALFVTTGITKSDESSTDDFYFKVFASLNSGPSGSITLRIDQLFSSRNILLHIINAGHLSRCYCYFSHYISPV